MSCALCMNILLTVFVNPEKKEKWFSANAVSSGFIKNASTSFLIKLKQNRNGSVTTVKSSINTKRKQWKRFREVDRIGKLLKFNFLSK